MSFGVDLGELQVAESATDFGGFARDTFVLCEKETGLIQFFSVMRNAKCLHFFS